MISNWRLNTVFFIVFVPLFALVVFRLIQSQVIEYDRFKVLAENQRTIDQLISTPRGTIYSSDGAVLAYNKPVWGVYIDVKNLREDEDLSKYDIIKSLSPILDIKEAELDDLINMELNYVRVASKVDEETKRELEHLELYPIRFEDEEKRIYPEAHLYAHVTGFVGKNDEGNEAGKYGIEGYFNGDLTGKTGFVSAELDTFGRQIVTGDIESITARKGRDITLTIDRGLQKIVYDGIKKGVEDYGAKSGTGVVLDPKTGAVLAMVNYPDYDPNAYWEIDDAGVLTNLAVAANYEFGSVGKVFTASAAIEENPENMTSEVDVPNGCEEILDYEVCNWNKKGYGTETLTEVLKHSSNLGIYEFAKKIGPEKLYNYLQKFGIGRLSNITLQEDATSFIKDWQEWNELDLASSSFGQTVSATPLQIVSGISAIANEGKRMQPYIVSRIEDDEKVIDIQPKVIDNPISKGTADTVTEMMVQVVQEGGFTNFVKEIEPYLIAGKTGTAQIPYTDRAGYQEDKVNATFVGFDATEDRKFIMLVKLEEPSEGNFASEVAVPVWVDIFLDLALYMGVIPVN